jgi:hypothetical protein
MRRHYRFLALLALPLLAITVLPAAEEENASGLPTPEKSDVPYLIHATNLVELEQSTANEETQKNDQLYWVAGANSPVQTPLAGPQFLFKSDEINPRDFQLYGFESKNGRREVVIRKKKKMVATPHFVSVFDAGPGLHRVRVDATLTNGEYCLTPNGSNAVFCFAVF